jgi:ribosome-binding factor A
MESIRQSKINKLLLKELSELFRAEARNLFGGAFITVTVVRVSPDLGVAKVYLSIMGNNSKNALKMIEEKNKEIRKRVGNKLGRQLRVIPELHFYIDDSLDYAMKIEELLKK